MESSPPSERRGTSCCPYCESVEGIRRLLLRVSIRSLPPLPAPTRRRRRGLSLHHRSPAATAGVGVDPGIRDALSRPNCWLLACHSSYLKLSSKDGEGGARPALSLYCLGLNQHRPSLQPVLEGVERLLGASDPPIAAKDQLVARRRGLMRALWHRDHPLSRGDFLLEVEPRTVYTTRANPSAASSGRRGAPGSHTLCG